jgi:hypothetical protein
MTGRHFCSREFCRDYPLHKLSTIPLQCVPRNEQHRQSRGRAYVCGRYGEYPHILIVLPSVL